MQYSINTIDLIKQSSDCLIVSIFQGKKFSQSAELLDKQSQGYIQRILDNGDLIEDCGKSIVLYNVPGITAPRVLLVYCGEESNLSVADFRKIISCMACALKPLQVDEITSFLTDISIKGCDFSKQVRHHQQSKPPQ